MAGSTTAAAEEPRTTTDGRTGDGALQSMDQVANWVRFADAKASVLTAGLGVVLVMLMGNTRTVFVAIEQGMVPMLIVGPLAIGVVAAFLTTLFWLVRALGPQTTVEYPQPNRFSWPSLLNVSREQLMDHLEQSDLRDDAWQAVLDLSALAARKFDACGRAVKSFAVLVLLAFACVGGAAGFIA